MPWYDRIGDRYPSNALLSLTRFWYTMLRFQAFFAANIILLLVAAGWLVKEVFPSIKLRGALAVAVLLMVVYIDALSNVYESLYRFTVVYIYQLGLVGNMLFAGLLYRASKATSISPSSVVPLALTIALTNGTNELSFILCCAMLAAYGLWGNPNRPCRLPLWYWLLVSICLVSGWVILQAPGNQVRTDSIATSISWWGAAQFTVAATGDIWLSWLSNTLLLPLTALAVPFTALHQSDGRLRLVLLGPVERERPEETLVPELLQALDTHPAVRHLPWSDDVPAFMALADLLVHASHREGFPNVPLQAGAMGCPIVCSHIPGNTDIVDHGRTGLTYPVGDAEALTAAIQAVLANPAAARQRALALRQRVEAEFDRKVIHSALLKRYQSLLSTAEKAEPRTP